MQELPRIERVAVEVPSTLRISWRGKRTADRVNLAGWIATGGGILAPLADTDLFRQARVASYGSAIAWDDDDLAIDALHLKRLADEQRPFGNSDLRAWQTATRLSNAEAAEFLGVSLSTWNSYRAEAQIPQPVSIALRAALRDPLLLQAHLRPRKAGRPRKAAG